MSGKVEAYVDTDTGTVVGVAGPCHLTWQLPKGHRNFMSTGDETLLFLGLEAARVRATLPHSSHVLWV